MNAVLESILPTTDAQASRPPGAWTPWWRATLAHIVLPLGASVLLVAVVLAAAAWSLRVRTLQNAQQQAQALAQVAAELTGHTLQNLEPVLAALSDLPTPSAPTPDLGAWWRLDAQGQLRARAPGSTAPHPALDARLWQTLQQAHTRTLLQPLPGSGASADTLLLLRAVRGPSGGFEGALLALLPVSRLGSVWQQHQRGPLGTLALYTPQGDLLLRNQHGAASAQTQHPPLAVMQGLAQSSAAAFAREPPAVHLYGYQPVGQPIAAAVVVSQPLEQVLAPWRQWVWISTALWVLLALGALASGWQLHRHTRLRNQSIALAQRQTLRLRELSRRILDAQEAERSRVARELHDELGQSLTAIKINLQAQAQFKDANPAQWQADNLSMVENALQQVRRLALGLRPSILDTLGLTPALQWMGRELSQRSHFAFALQQDPDWPSLDDDTQTCLFRIAQEALTNIARHAAAHQVQISLRVHHEQLWMEVRDDGQGFDPSARQRAHHSMGLSSMAERAALVGARLSIDSAPAQGCTIRVTLPRPATSA